jgi:hypothetical protein
MDQYRSLYERSLKEPNAFWGEVAGAASATPRQPPSWPRAQMARKHLSWFRAFTEVRTG